jgi:hypothetical protein
MQASYVIKTSRPLPFWGQRLVRRSVERSKCLVGTTYTYDVHADIQVKPHKFTQTYTYIYVKCTFVPVVKHNAMEACGAVKIELLAFSTSTLDGGGCSTSRSGCFTAWKKPLYPTDRRLCGPQSRSGGGSERKNVCHCRKWNPGLSTSSADYNSWAIRSSKGEPEKTGHITFCLLDDTYQLWIIFCLLLW